ncbi:penicillin-insensitive murein endopeptidase [Oceanisphaera psychrotolerans]|uniref:Penicillin-insensitive murein endopeptidase n=1 Tax=Oceanisphaera psychrotolerans TaxID=1414654 RepID=A0A1J4QGN4_9GAMM|nr:penicillin-insensitive murein endopeptidase [Oceanisphaera psychrotolerans]OIN14024.1 penicillin-insensitive murein endopeptidase [Oceanisphaera psychrotolerans]
MIKWIGLLLWLPSLVWAEAIGSYAAGCQLNARPLPASGPGFYVIRANRERFYGQPPLIDYLQDLGRHVRQAGLPPMLVADIAMERGGPFRSGHRSHQTGLDADIWLRPPPRNPDTRRLERIKAVDMVDHRYYILNAHFRDPQRQLIALAAQDERVSRIFVHPLIKSAMCRAYGEADWLGKLRPWFGHSSHFHVRLHCPPGDNQCEPQAAVPAGTGCGRELASWLNDKAGAIPAGSRPPYRPVLPERCIGWVR